MTRKKYDYIIVGAGLFGAVFAHEVTKQGKKCLIVEKRDHIGGNVFTESIEDIIVHRYGAHIFHTSNVEVWNYVNSFVEFNRFTNSPIANYKGDLYNLPFNMNTYYQLWGVKTPEEAQKQIESQKAAYSHIDNPKNLEEQALVLGGKDIYEKLIKGYTEKQWGRPATEIPAFIIRRLPFRFTFDNNYFNDKYQGVPKGGYTSLIKKLIAGIETRLGVDYLSEKSKYDAMGNKIIYSGKIDEYFKSIYGSLEYRSLHFEHELLDMKNYQGNAVVNYTDKEIPFTRIIEHKHFDFGEQDHTYITHEYPHEFSKDNESYYPINDEKNERILNQYSDLAKREKHVLFGGRLAEYKYYDMHQIVESALSKAKNEILRSK
jgi:UDP-galactopyranose mutase